MQKLQAWMEKHMLPTANKIAQQKYLKAIATGMVAMMPVSIIASVALILISPPMASATLKPGLLQTIMIGWEWIGVTFHFPLFTIYTVSNTLSAIIAALGIGWALASHYNMEEKEGVIPISLSVISFLLIAGFGTDGSFSIANLGGTGYFTAIVVSILTIEIYRFLIEKNIGIIDMSKFGVPSFISASFRGIVPCTVIIILLVTLNTLVVTYVHTTIPDLVGIVLSPLVMFIDSPLAILLFGFLVSLFWWFGIHDTFITSPLGILWNPIGLANQAAHVAGTALPHIVTSAFWWTFMAIGGSGATFSLCLLLLAAKSKHLKMVGKLGIIPSLFNINEPIIFGLPIMLNPLMVIPFILALPINGLITYAAMATGLVAKTFTTASWNLFAPFAAFISTMDWKAAALTIILILIDIVLYFPFVKVMDNQKLKEEQMLAEQAAVK